MAADVEGVQHKLEELHRASARGFSDVEMMDPAALVENIASEVIALDPHVPGTETDVALLASFVFESEAPRDLLSLVSVTVNASPKVTKKARMAAVRAVGDFIKLLQGSPIIDRYAVRIKDGVWDVFTRETESQEVRAHALRPLRQLLKMKPARLAAGKWQVASMWNTIKEQYRLGSKTSQTVKGELLKLAGTLLLVYGSNVPELHGEVATMLGWCDSAMSKNADNKKLQKALQPQLVAGALACVDLVCSAGYEERYAFSCGSNGERLNKALYMHLLTAVADGTVETLTRFEVPAKALRFFRRHAGLFAESIGPLPRAEQLYGYMEKCATYGGKSSRRKLKKHALPAIEAVLREVSRYAASADDTALQLRTVDTFEGKFLAMLEVGRPSSEETSVALAGLAAMSTASAALSSYEGAAEVTDRLMVNLDAALGRLGAIGLVDGDSDDETESSGVFAGNSEASPSASGNEWRRDQSLKLEAQYLRTLACRVGVLGGILCRPTASASSGSDPMDIDDGGGGEAVGTGLTRQTMGESVASAVPGRVMKRLDAIATRLVESYAVLNRTDKSLACRGLCQLWLALCGRGQSDNLPRLLASVIPKSVLRASLMEEEEVVFGESTTAIDRSPGPVNPLTGRTVTRLCFAHADLWRRNLVPGPEDHEILQAWPSGKETGIRIIYAEIVAPQIYDAILASVLTMIKRLDLHYDPADADVSRRTRQVHDQMMFQNLVAFCQELLPTCNPALLLEWAPLLCQELVERSLAAPAVSGFYRLVTLLFRETAKAGYFDQPILAHNPAADEDVGARAPSKSWTFDQRDADTTNGASGDGGRSICRRVLRRYLEWITVRLSGFQGEVLAACTEALLSAPPGLLDGDLGPLVPAFKVALTSGATDLPTATVAITALEKWNDEHRELLTPYLAEVLPCLDKHLSAEASAVDSATAATTRRHSKGRKASTTTSTAVTTGGGGRSPEASERSLRTRIVRFLGRLGGRNHLVAGEASCSVSNSLAWDTEERVVLEVPYKDQKKKISICLDGVLQRLVDLARHEATRQTKVLATECLHALVVYMVGCTAADPSLGRRTGKPGEFSSLFRRVFPAVLRLAVDVEETTRTLFSKLTMQLVRWFSQAQTDNPDTIALLDCLGEGVAAEEGGPLRRMCAEGLVEFLNYAIKQSSKGQQAQGPVAVGALLTRVFALASHPDKNRRLGGLLAFNQLCRPLREETSLVSRYALRLLHVALISLRRAHHDHSALGVDDAASDAVNRALRIIRHSIEDLGDRADLLRRNDERGQLRSVQDLVDWVWERVGSVETRFRRKCMAVLLRLCPLLVGDSDVAILEDREGTRIWVWKHLKSSGRGGISEAVRVFEAALHAPNTDECRVQGDDGSGIVGDLQAEAMNEKARWERIGTAADCYMFACEMGIITADELFLRHRAQSSKTQDGAAVSGIHDGEGKRGRSTGKKRKAPALHADGDDTAASQAHDVDLAGAAVTPPRVLRALASVSEKFGTFVQDFPFQSLAGRGFERAAAPTDTSSSSPEGGGLGRDDVTGTLTSARSAVRREALSMDDPGLLPSDRAAARQLRAVVLRRSFTLLAECLSSTDTREEMASMLVAQGLWGRNMHVLLIYSLLWPWAGNLLPRPSDGDEVQKFLPAAAERLLKHWKTLDRATGITNGIRATLRKVLQVRVCDKDGASSAGAVKTDLCQWLLSQSLSWADAYPPLPVASRSPKSSNVVREHQHDNIMRVLQGNPKIDDELIGRVLRGYRTLARVDLCDSVGGGGASAGLAEGIFSSVLNLPAGLRPALERRANAALRLCVELGLPAVATRAESDVALQASSILAGVLDVRPVAQSGSGTETTSAESADPHTAGVLTRGALFYRRFSGVVHEVLLAPGPECPWPRVCASLVDACAGAKVRCASGSRSALAAQAFSVLEGVASSQSVLPTTPSHSRFIEPAHILNALVPELDRLVQQPEWAPPHLKSSSVTPDGPSGTGRMLREFLRLCHRLLRLAAAAKSIAVGESPWLAMLLEMTNALAAGTLASASAVVTASAKADALALLPFLRPCITRRASQYGLGVSSRVPRGESAGGPALIPALEEMISRHFPLEDSREPTEGSDEATTFALLLRGLLSAFVRCGDLALLELLFGTLAEGHKHLHYGWVSRALDAFVLSVDVESHGVVESILGFCLDKISDQRVALGVKAALGDKVCLPLLRCCPVEITRAIYLSRTAGSNFSPAPKATGSDASVLQRLSVVIERRSKETGKFLAGPFLASLSFALVETLYEALERDALRPLADEAFGRENALRELTKTIAKAWKALKEVRLASASSWLELRCRRALFSCVCTVVRATQDQEKHFDALVWCDSLHDAALAGTEKMSVLSLVLDMSKEHTFEVSPPHFQSVPLSQPRPPLLTASGGEGGRKHWSVSVTASGMLAQSSLGFGGDSLAVFGGFDTREVGKPVVEDSTETYSSQIPALTAFGASGEPEAGDAVSTLVRGSQSQGASLTSTTESEARERGSGGSQADGRDGSKSNEERKVSDIFLEMSHVNKEPCMRSLLLVLQEERRMFQDSWRDRAEQSGGEFEPAWSTNMRVKVADQDLPRNVRLFAFQFALNVPATEALRPWASKWIVAMADFVLAPLPEGLRKDGEQGLHYLLRDFVHVLVDETEGGWGTVVREARSDERRRQHSGEDSAAICRQPLLDVGNRLVSHLMSVASYPEGKTGMLRANLNLISELIGLFGAPRGEGEGHDGEGEKSTGGDGHVNELRPSLQSVVEMLSEKEGHTGGAHARIGSAGAQARHRILTGLNLLGTLIPRHVPIFVSSVEAADDLARVLPRVCLSYAQKNTFETGAELLAMALQHMSWLRGVEGLLSGEKLCDQCASDEGEWFPRAVAEKLVSMGRDGSKRGEFLHAVSIISGACPPILTRRLLLSAIEAIHFADAVRSGRFLSMLADAYPVGNIPVLEVQDLFTRLQPFLPALLLETDREFFRGSKETGQSSEWIPTVQLSALRLVKALAPSMTSKQLGLVLHEHDAHSLVRLATPSTFLQCREVVYDTLLDLYLAHRGPQSNPNDKARGGAALTLEQVESVRCALLRGLSDPDDAGMLPADARDEFADDSGRIGRRGIRQRLLDVFDAPGASWGADGGLDGAPGQRLLSLMRDMFEARTARSWLRFAPFLMLRPAEQAAEYDALLFKNGLADCEFVDMPVATGAELLSQHSMDPLFVLASQLQTQDAGGAHDYSGGNLGTLSTDVIQRQAGMVRATQAYRWSQTQASGGYAASNSAKLSPASTRRSRYASQTQSRMLGASGGGAASQSIMPPPAPRPPGMRGRNWQPRGGVTSQVGGVGQRFWQTSGGSISSLAKGESHALQRRRAAKSEREQTKRAKRAVTYRKYRDGELPDIQIKLGDVLSPLQHLSMLDGGIAREVLLQLLKGVYVELPRDDAASERQRLNLQMKHEAGPDATLGVGRGAVGTLLQRMLSVAKTETVVVACLLSACRAISAVDLLPSGGDDDEQEDERTARGRKTSNHGGYTTSQSRRGRLLSSSTNPSNSTRRKHDADAGVSGARNSQAEEEPFSLCPKLVANTAIASLNVHAGILFVEEQICRSVGNGSSEAVHVGSASGGGQRRGGRGQAGGEQVRTREAGVTASATGQQDAWLQLSRLYASLGERDALVGVSARASRLEGTRQALDYGLSGELEKALEEYVKLVRLYYKEDTDDSQGKDVEDVVEASEMELHDWDMHQLECMLQLGKWKGIREHVASLLPQGEEGEGGNDGERGNAAECRQRLWAVEPSARDDLLPYFFRSILDDQDRRKEDLDDFLEDVMDARAPQLRLSDSSAVPSEYASSSSCTRLEWLEVNMPGELARAFLLRGELGRARQNVQRCYDRFQEIWAALHPCAEAARREQLRGLQMAVEVEDFLDFSDQRAVVFSPGSSIVGTLKPPSASSLPGRVTALIGKWSQQLPSRQSDSLAWWRAMLTHRQDCFSMTRSFLEEQGLPAGERVQCTRDMMKHAGELSLTAAGAATAQGILPVAKRLIQSYSSIKRCAGELGQGTAYGSSTNAREAGHEHRGGGENEWDLGLTLTIEEYNRAKLERRRLAGTRTGTSSAEVQVEMVTDVLKVLKGITEQQHAAMLKARLDENTKGSGERTWGIDEWDRVGAAALRTRMRLLTLQGRWLETHARLLAAETVTGTGQRGESASATSVDGALAQLGEAAKLGERLISSGAPSSATSGVAIEHESTADFGEAAGEAILSFAILCEALAVRADGLRSAGKGREELASLAVDHYLRAMAAGSGGARDRFPRVLFLLGNYPRARKAFSERAPSVPVWTFLRWVSQMLSVTGRHEGPVVTAVLEAVARVYPRALFYPLLMTKSSSSSVSGNVSAKAQEEMLSKLTAMTFDPTAEAFVEALRGLHHPELRLCDGMKRVVGLLKGKQVDLARQSYLKLRSDCLVATGCKTGDEKVGLYNRNFAKEHGSKFDRAFGKDGQKLNLSKANGLLAEALGLAEKARHRSAPRVLLSAFAPWLSDFDSNLHTLEVPGQHGGIINAPPRLSQHARVVSFEGELLVMKSLRMPKRLTMHGDDERDHMFLVKGGEDLRVDERVEQLFDVMNAVMDASVACRRAHLRNKTYKVVPVTADVGLIEWVQDTQPLKSVIERRLGNSLHNLEAARVFRRFVGGQGGPADFHKMYKEASRDKVEKAFSTCCSLVSPTDALRTHLMAMAPSPEAFLTCRAGFARSLASLNACSYVLGIGDRHLDNFLLDKTTGTVFGIDFGAAFGVGTTELRVPELIPFRLTNQFRTLLQPLDSVGMLKGHMVSTLHALRGGAEVLLATMDVFLNEPVIDWVREDVAYRQKTKGIEAEEVGEEAGPKAMASQPLPPSEARRKIRNAQRKLEGANPVAILVDDLAQNKAVQSAGTFKKLDAICWGRSGSRTRSKPELGDGVLSVEDQVECLIDLATDPDVLGRQWTGLATWV